MNLNLSFQQGLNTSQQLSLAPQLLQWLRLLHMSTLDLSQVIHQELESNPALELNEDTDSDTSNDSDALEAEGEALQPDKSEEDLKEEQIDNQYEFLKEAAMEWNDESSKADSSTSYDSCNDAMEKYEYAFNSIEEKESLQQHLLKQAGLASLPKEDRELIEVLIGFIDDRGYLEIGLNELAAFSGAPIEKLESALKAVQSMDPTGVGARNLPECLLLQIPDDEEHRLARLLAEKYLDAMGRRQYADVAKLLGVPEAEILEAMTFIRGLNPRPGGEFSDISAARYVKPDVTLRKGEKGWKVDLNNEYIPQLRISASCRRLLNKDHLSSQEMSYIRDKIRSANFIIQGIRQRQETMRRVTEEILKVQADFLETENGVPRPLTMAQLAEKIGVHETTVSRAIANKHIQTPRGLFPMKHFFQSGYNCSDGTSMTPECVRDLIAQAVDGENSGAPLTDLQISARLKAKGLRVARRTIAKYREELGIPSSKERLNIFSSSKESRSNTSHLVQAAV